MASIFYGTGGNLSALTPNKVVYDNPTWLRNTSYYGYLSALNTARYVAFTPSDAGDCAGVFMALNLKAVNHTQTVTVTLQEQTAPSVWTDRASKTLYYDEIVGTHAAAMDSAHNAWKYFQFTAAYAITAAANTWRIKALSTDANAGWNYTGSTVYCCAVIISTATTYSGPGNLYIADEIIVVLDQSVTQTTLVLGVNAELVWQNPPASAYTLTLTNFCFSANSAFRCGSSTLRIPFAQRATIAVTNWCSGFAWGGNTNIEVEMYGQIPAGVSTTLAANAAGSQKVIVTAANMTGIWNVGDTIWVYGCVGGEVQSRTVASISGTSVTLNANLNGLCLSGTGVVNATLGANYGVLLGASFTCPDQPMFWKAAFSGINASGYKIDINISNNTYPPSAAGKALITPFLIDNIFSAAAVAGIVTVTTTNSYSTADIEVCYNGSVISNIFVYRTSVSAFVMVTSNAAFTVSSIYAGDYTTLASFTAQNLTMQGCTFTNHWSTYAVVGLNLKAGTLTGCCFIGDGISLAGINVTIASCVFDSYTAGGCSALRLNAGAVVGLRVNNCSFGVNVRYLNTVLVSAQFVQAILNNCTFGANTNDVSDITATLNGSYVRFDTYHATANDHRSWWCYGKMRSVGDGLTDTTVHTTGTSKFALRFEPTSSANNLVWAFAVPTGNILGQTMTVAVWCKIANAAYYAGTHQKPRLTVKYDNLTEVYAEATAGTGWQLLYVSFAPTTSYGQIMVTLSGRTDAVGANAYVYWDDFAAMYPAGYKLDLGGLDLWTDALPVTPPIATVISAMDVWLAPLSQMTGAGTMGQALAALLTGQYSFNKATGVEQIMDAAGNVVSSRTVTDTETTVSKI